MTEILTAAALSYSVVVIVRTSDEIDEKHNNADRDARHEAPED